MKILFLVTFVIELLFGIGFTAGPKALLGVFGVSLDPFGTALARLFGSALLGFSTLAWYTFKSSSPDLQKAAVRSMFVYWLLSTVFMTVAQLNGLMNTMGWSSIMLHLGFLIWTGVFSFKKN